MKRKRRLTDEEFARREFDFSQARRMTAREVEAARKAYEAKTGKPHPLRGRPPKPEHERHLAVSIRLHPKALAWARREATRRGLGYQTVINETLLHSAGISRS